MVEKWYNSHLGKRLGTGAIIISLGLGIGYVESRDKSFEVENQRLKTIEALAKDYGSQLTPNEFKIYLENLNLIEKD